ncbi:MAG TPA: TetR/AcrR family transcriptional regulator [Saprospiraceae bacterium]|nr:TetR/AcrR family transcriptional regulator [Saprospiraceae bacterium]MCB9328117.1 TetR/AcrR family transcriptional regulator [Lewinellaceae bacterium]HPK09072.1 TetR/AcrR family transcriptional regulator [Saprospiraceae bacterium]HPQ20211.1 TetR/AcrR family transcriptional regulator [Saprospiraceae bacterium]HRX29922.1 TetR/AcrR family transcriptional regulator [Saprospiraceae bacterium]
MTVTDKILDYCTGAFFRLGIKSVSMDDISREIGISKKTLYAYYPAKQKLVYKAVNLYVKQEEKDIASLVESSADAIDEVINIARHNIKFFQSISPSAIYDLQKYYPEIWKSIETKHFSFIYNIVKENIDRGIHEKIYREDLNPDIIARLYVQKALSIADDKIFPIHSFDKTLLVREFIKYHLHGISNENGLKKLETIVIS